MHLDDISSEWNSNTKPSASTLMMVFLYLEKFIWRDFGFHGLEQILVKFIIAAERVKTIGCFETVSGQ